jgi:hypothetical protein
MGDTWMSMNRVRGGSLVQFELAFVYLDVRVIPAASSFPIRLGLKHLPLRNVRRTLSGRTSRRVLHFIQEDFYHLTASG